MSHLTYCISSWGGVSTHKLQRLFKIQKRCVRILFGNESCIDSSKLYETSSQSQTSDEHIILSKEYCLEHTKPLFNENKLLTVFNLHTLHTFMEVFKVMKYHSPISIYELLTLGHRAQKVTLILPKVNLDISKHNFVFKSAAIWNSLNATLFNRCIPQSDGIVIPGSTENSDMAASISVIKNKLKCHLLEKQKLGDKINWDITNQCT